MPYKNRQYLNNHIAVGLLLIVFLISASLAYSHGGKHAPGKFTHLQALKKATELYDKLIEKEKLDQSWENTLDINIFLSFQTNKKFFDLLIWNSIVVFFLLRERKAAKASTVHSLDQAS